MHHITLKILTEILNEIAPNVGDKFDAHDAQKACLRRFPNEFGYELIEYKNGDDHSAVQKLSMQFSRTIDQAFTEGPVQIKKVGSDKHTSANLLGEDSKNQQWVVVSSPIVVPNPRA